MTELTLAILDHTTGQLVVDTEDATVAQAATDVLGVGAQMGCANPVQVLHPSPLIEQPAPHARINGFWHDSFVEGPGRRSVVRFQGCPIRCDGCWVPFTHDANGGYDVNVGWLADALLDPAYQRDGVTIVGGEPFAQPEALCLLVMSLVVKGCLDITIYTGYTLEALLARNNRSINAVLAGIDLLIDGPFVAKRAHAVDCGCDDETRRWSGSCNQRVHRLR